MIFQKMVIWFSHFFEFRASLFLFTYVVEPEKQREKQEATSLERRERLLERRERRDPLIGPDEHQAQRDKL